MKASRILSNVAGADGVRRAMTVQCPMSTGVKREAGAGVFIIGGTSEQ